MTPDMLERARRNLAGSDYPQVEFHKAEIDHLPLPAAFADVVLSNCVINLAPDKSAVYREMFRILKPGGRIAIADIVLRGDSARMRRIIEQLPTCGCVSRALDENRYLEIIGTAGFEGMEIVSERSAMVQTQVQEFAERLKREPGLIEDDLRELLVGQDPASWGISAQAVTLVGRRPVQL